MYISEEILNKYKKQIDRLSTETLILISNDDIRAYKAAIKVIKKQEPEKANDTEYLQALVNGMRELAEKVLEKRNKK